jgi:hypothetical protein
VFEGASAANRDGVWREALEESVVGLPAVYLRRRGADPYGFSVWIGVELLPDAVAGDYDARLSMA